MKINFLILFNVISLSIMAQTTPSPLNKYVGSSSDVIRDFGDTITFNAYTTGQVITDQYWSNGAIFSGYQGGANPDVYDYVGSYGPVIKSLGWYEAFKLNFVYTSDSTLTKKIRWFYFENPINSEIDYISANFYDQNDSLIYHYLSTSPEMVSIDLGSNAAAYVVFDDSAETAYVVDNIWFAADSVETEVAQPTSVAGSSGCYPNPMSSMTTIIVSGNIEMNNSSLELFDVLGRRVRSEENIHGNRIEVQRGILPSGNYFYRITEDSRGVASGCLVMQ